MLLEINVKGVIVTWKISMQKILVNKIKCKKCGDVIESTHHYDFKTCQCGAVSVDGGKTYKQWEEYTSEEQTAIANCALENIIDLSIVFIPFPFPLFSFD